MRMLKIAVAVSLAFAAQSAMAQAFNSGIPAGWTTTGMSGTSGADGVVTLAPGGGTAYGWVSTAGGVGLGSLDLGLGSETTGSVLRSTAFSASALDPLNFSFNFITSDGAGFADYAWSKLLNAGDLSMAALLFTARTTPSSSSVPGFGMPAITAVIVPPSVTIAGGVGSSVWSPLGSSSGTCYISPSSGCGNTGWVAASYTIGAAGSYMLEFGVVNWTDAAFQTGLAFDGITVAGTPVGVIPEPETYAMLLAGLGLLGLAARRRKLKEAAVA